MEKSTIRSWLNNYESSINSYGTDYTDNGFLKTAFSNSEQDAIIDTTVVNENNSNYGTEGGINTTDKIFLLSESEVYITTIANGYGFVTSYETKDEARCAKSSTFAKAMGTWTATRSSNEAPYIGNSCWWLRSPGMDLLDAANVMVDGLVNYGGSSNEYGFSVRPALNLNLTYSNLWSYAGTVSSDGTAVPAIKVTGITISGPATNVTAGNKLELTASVLPEDATDKAVTWSSNNTEAATVSTDGIVTAMADAGGKTVTITATAQDGSGVYGSYELTVIRPKVSKIEITGPSKDVTAGQGIQLTATVTPSNALDEVAWSSSDTSAAIVDRDGNVAALSDAYGKTVKITATAQDGSGVSGSYELTVVRPKVSQIKITGPSGSVTAGQGIKLTATVSPSNAADAVTWSSSDTEVATVAEDGMVTAMADAGGKPVTIKATAQDGSGVYETYELTVVKRKVSKIEITGPSKSVTAGEGIRLTATVTPSDAVNEVIWSSSDTSVAIVDEKGNVAALSDAYGQKVTITATAKDGSGVYGSYELTVATPKVTKIEITGPEKSVVAGQGIRLTAKVTPSNAVNTVIWRSSDTSVAAVAADGTVTSMADAGGKTVTITATALDGSWIRGSYELAVVTPKVTKIEITGPSKGVLAGQEIRLTAGVTPANALNTLTWSSSDMSVATVAADGTVTSMADAGGKTVTITAAAQDGSEIMGSYELAVVKSKVSAIEITGPSESMTAGTRIRLTAAITPADALNEVTWRSSDTSAAVVDEEGNVAALSDAGGKTVTVTATAKDGSGISGSYTLTIVKPEVKAVLIKLTGISHKIAAGKKIKLTAKVTPSDATDKAVSWKSSNKKIATVTSNGTVTLKKKTGGKSVTITATAKDGSKVYGKWKIRSMKGVVKKIAVSGVTSVKKGSRITLKAKVTASKGANRTLKWTSSNKKYATVSSKGVVKGLVKGKTVKITASATDGSGKKATKKIKIK